MYEEAIVHTINMITNLFNKSHFLSSCICNFMNSQILEHNVAEKILDDTILISYISLTVSFSKTAC